MDRPVPTWVRLGLLVLLAPAQLLTGLWAVFAPERWFESFPGFDPRLVAAEPPFNAHLATDAGAGFLASGVALVAAAWIGRRSAVWVGLLTFAAFALPHLGYHLANEAPGLTDAQNLTNVVILAFGPAVAAVLAWGARGRPDDDPAPTAAERRDEVGAPT